MSSAKDFKMPWGKYRGETLEEIYIEDLGYLEWLLDEQKKAIRRGYPAQMVGLKIEECFKEMRNVRICK